MKFTSVALGLATAGSVMAAQPHHHAHRHNHVRRVPDVTQVVNVPGPTVYKFELDGEPISEEKVCQGIANGSLLWADGEAPADVCSSTSSAAPSSTPVPAQFYETSSSSTPTPTTTPTPTSTPTSTSTAAPTTSSTSSSSSSSSSTPAPSPSSSPVSAGINSDFPDGVLDCDTFPSEYGAVPLDYLGLGGWSGIQYVTILGEVVSDIITAVFGDTCRDGAMCSYACPAGYQKSQWPSTQGSTGQSVGGLQCKNGKLYLTNPELSKKICIPGTGGVEVQNTLSEQVAVCRTDYPGTESETIPLSLSSGALEPLTCPDGDSYFKWNNAPTSAQYYVNPKGISTEKGCQWGDGSENIGNWAPINLGVGKKNGVWLSIFQNKPTTNAKLDFNIRIEGDNLSGICKYENGMFYSSTGANSDGCTTQVMSGTARYVFY